MGITPRYLLPETVDQPRSDVAAFGGTCLIALTAGGAGAAQVARVELPDAGRERGFDLAREAFDLSLQGPQWRLAQIFLSYCIDNQHRMHGAFTTKGMLN
ncbi:TPA: hypothetical protein L6A81_11935 [Pseudomonas aeruginosa]|nr:hypothetical protein [Pseudomonas aeruginosa]